MAFNSCNPTGCNSFIIIVTMRKRILLISLLVTTIAIIIYSLVSTQLYYNIALEDRAHSLEVYVNMFDEGAYPLDDEGAKAFSDELNGARVTFMDGEGNVLGESEAENIETDHSDREEVREAIGSDSGEGFAVRASDTLSQEMMYYCRAVEVDGTVYLVRVAEFLQSQWSMYVRLLPSLAAYFIIDILGCLVFTFIATYFIMHPVEELTREAAAGGTVKTRYHELSTLADILNERNRNIEWKMSEVEEEKKLVERAQNSKNEFIANITHEMNTPLTSIKGYAELLSSGMLNEEQTKLAVKTISSQTERLTNLIACIINYNEIDDDTLPPYDVDLSKLAREMLAVVKPEADKSGIALIDEIDDNVIVQSRHELMTQLLGNLIRNAIRYNKKGGTVTVELNYKRLVVSDTGIGIAPENMDKVFSRFFTVDKSHSGKNGGFGLGLAVCRKICHRSGWRISVQSELGKGSTFTVDFGLR
ncbi:MAG TPA: hypothetical protein IAC67_06170 [Candidatus Coproplasma excrementipullorum]|nr:hypothetical protein [Candidatus Coproplasma excrementipullorum]